MRTWLLAAALGSGICGVPVLAQTTPAPAPEEHGGGMGRGMMRADTNGDGVVTRDEYLAQVDQRFDRMDANHDGSLSDGERPMRGRGRMRDANGIAPPSPPPSRPAADSASPQPMTVDDLRPPQTRDAYRAAALRRFDRMDANHDGRIDQAEMASMMETMRARRGAMGDAPPPPAGE